MPPTQGIIFTGNMEEPIDSRSYLLGLRQSTTAAPPNAFPLTVLMEVFPMTGNRSFWVAFFNNVEFETSFSLNGSVDYYGGHPYPHGATAFGTPNWEMAVEHIDVEGNAVVFDQWYQQAFRARNNAGTKEYEFYTDWPNRGTPSTIITDSHAANADASVDPAFVIGDAPWSQGHECFKGIIGRFRVFEAYLTTTEIDNEFTTPGSSGVSYFFYNPGLIPSDITDKSGNGNDFEWLATSFFTALQFKDGTLGIGAIHKEVRTGITDPHTFSFTPAGTPRGIAIAAIHGTSSTDHISSMTYGGVSVSRSATITDTATELGRTDWWFLGSGVPTGTQTVSVDLSSATTDDIVFVVIEITASRDVEVIDTETQGENAANPSRTPSKTGRTAFSLGALYGGGADGQSFAPNADVTTIMDHDLGAFFGEVFVETVVDTTDKAIGGTMATDDLAMAVITIAEVAASSSLAPIRRWDRRIVPLL